MLSQNDIAVGFIVGHDGKHFTSHQADLRRTVIAFGHRGEGATLALLGFFGAVFVQQVRVVVQNPQFTRRAVRLRLRKGHTAINQGRTRIIFKTLAVTRQFSGAAAPQTSLRCGAGRGCTAIHWDAKVLLAHSPRLAARRRFGTHLPRPAAQILTAFTQTTIAVDRTRQIANAYAR